MKRKKVLSALCGVILLFGMTGCPYNSKVPLSDPQKSVIDTTLLGKWVTFHNGKSASADTLMIMKFNDHEYLIVFTQTKGGKCLSDFGRGFNTIINNVNILNFAGLEEPANFNFSRYLITGDFLITSSASDQFIKEKFSSSNEFFNFFKNNMDKERFFETADTLKKVK